MLVNFLRLAAISEVGVAIAMLTIPGRVVALLLGIEISGTEVATGRFFGIALLALMAACWPGVPQGESAGSVFRALMIYNVVFAVYLAYLGAFRGVGGSLLWLAVVFHAAVTLALIMHRKGRSPTGAAGT